MDLAAPPPAPPPNPQPPSTRHAARVINEAWKDPDWGTLIWTTVTTGARRGEMCALRWSDLDLDSDAPTAWIRRAISKDENHRWIESDTKTHQQRRVALDTETALVLLDHRDRCRNRATALGIELADDAFVFSRLPDGTTFPVPDSVSQRYDRLVGRLGIDTSLHKLRHYSATELILAGVDVRTVGGRLGHGGGGVTTLRVYTAFVAEADQRAAHTLSGRMPERPTPIDPEERPKIHPRAPYEHIAAALRRRILDGDLAEGDGVPSMKELVVEHAVSVGTAHRALSLLKKWGLIETRAGKRALVLKPPKTTPEPAEPTKAPDVVPVTGSAELLDLEILHLGQAIRKVRAEADPNSAPDLRQLLVDAVRRHGGGEAEIGDYEMNVRYAGERGLITTFVATGPGVLRVADTDHHGSGQARDRHLDTGPVLGAVTALAPGGGT